MLGGRWARDLMCVAEFDASLRDALFERGYSREFGGRELKRTITRDVTVPLARYVRDTGRSAKGLRVKLGWEGALTIEVLEENVVAASAATGRKGRK